jgi:apolipoprotein N-acyltransferase
LVRAANTGISAVIDPLGRVIKSLPLGTEGVMDASLPRRIDPPLYARTGDVGVALVFGAALIIIVRHRAKRG